MGATSNSNSDPTGTGSKREARNDSTAGSQLKVYPAYQTVKEGGTAVLRCRDEGATRLPVSWFKQQANRLLELKQSTNVDLRAGRLAIRRVALSDAAVYLCRSALDSITAVLSVQQGEISFFLLLVLLRACSAGGSNAPSSRRPSSVKILHSAERTVVLKWLVAVWPLDVIFLVQ